MLSDVGEATARCRVWQSEGPVLVTCSAQLDVAGSRTVSAPSLTPRPECDVAEEITSKKAIKDTGPVPYDGCPTRETETRAHTENTLSSRLKGVQLCLSCKGVRSRCP